MPTRSPSGLVEYRTHYRWAVIVVTVLFLALFYRFFILQIMRGGDYQREQATSRQRSERIPAPRGQILDRNGEVLARNVDTHDLVMRPMHLRHPERAEELLRKLLKLDDQEDAKLRELIKVGTDDPTRYDKIVVRRDLVSEWCPFDSAKLDPLEPKRRTLWCSQCGRSYGQVAPGAGECPHGGHALRWNENHTGAECRRCDEEFVAGTSCAHDGAPLRERTWSLRCPECGRTFNNEKAIIEANLYQMPGVDVETSFRRVYPHRNLVAHLIGYMNEVNAKDLEAEDSPYSPGDRVGRSGIERALEAELRGAWGQRNYIIDRPQADGPIVQRPDPDRPDRAMVDGQAVRLTIDLELQRIARRALKYHRSGAAVVLDVESGEILALYSKPSFDPNLWSGRLPIEVYNATRSNPYSPMLNKTITAYAPGSVYKIVPATAGLHNHTVTARTDVHCAGYYEFGGRRFRCHQRGGHGSMDLIHALSRSCDIYFYKLGELVGIDMLKDYAVNWFGFGRPTGIEVAESVGIVPDKEWHKKEDRVWMPGFTLSTAVGQKDVRATPLQVARAFAIFANGGKLVRSHVVKQLEDRDGKPTRVTEITTDGMLALTPEETALLNEGFWRAVNDEHGTAFNARVDGIEVSGKTGTAEAAESKAGVSEEVARWLRDDHAWFVGYAPSRKPEVVVCVFLEHGHSGGKAAAPIAMRIFQGWFARRTPVLPASPDAPPLPNPITSEGRRDPPAPGLPPPQPVPAPKPPPREKPPEVNTVPIDLE